MKSALITCRRFLHSPNERGVLRGAESLTLPKRSIIIRMDTTLTPRQITHDEKKAAEAAFAGRPFNPKWSDAARIVYDGLLAAMGKEARAVDTRRTRAG